MDKIKQAVILCGGLGTRLSPITDTIPKPMVEINKIPFLWYLLDKISDNGIKRFLLLTGYLGDNIQSYFGNGRKFNWIIEYSKGPINWDTGRRIWEAKDLIDDNFLLCYADNFVQIRLEIIYEKWIKDTSKIWLSLSHKKKGNVIFLDKQHIKYEANRSNINSNLVELGFMFIKKELIINLIKKINNTPNIDLSKVLDLASKSKKLCGYIIIDNYHSIGDIKRLEITRKYLTPKKIILLDRDGVINIKAPKGKYINNCRNFIFIEKSILGLKMLSEKGFKFIVITNQAGIATKDLTDQKLEDIHRKMISKLNELNIDIVDIFVSKDHWQSNHFRRKPNPGMFFEASSKYLFRLDKTFYIGDDLRDCEAAFNANCQGLIISDNINYKNIYSSLRFTDLEKMVPHILEKYNLYLNQLEFVNNYA